MTSALADFAQLLAPFGTDEFFARHWERQHLLLHRNDPKFYESLLTAADLEGIISHTDARYPAIRLAKGGNYFAPEAYTRNIKHGDESFLGVPDVRRISEEYRQGATIALPALHRTWPALGMLCDRMTTEFDHPVHANGYMTPGNAAGFTPHYDVHEVFVLQIAGSKRWSLYAPVIELPHRNQICTPQSYSGQVPFETVDLNAGDLLYLPRGVLHSTTTAASFSAHVTIGITVYTWVDVLKETLQQAIDTPELRKSLSPGFASREAQKPALRLGLCEALDRLRAQTDVGRLIDVFTARVRAARAPRTPPFQADVVVVTLDSILEPPPAGNYAFIEEAGETMLEFRGVRYRLSAPVASAVRALCARTQLRGAELTDQLDPESLLGLLQQLFDIGFLRLAR
jgi:ribosomal protein L16 Arg81 hydroxylase